MQIQTNCIRPCRGRSKPLDTFHRGTGNISFDSFIGRREPGLHGNARLYVSALSKVPTGNNFLLVFGTVHVSITG